MLAPRWLGPRRERVGEEGRTHPFPSTAPRNGCFGRGEPRGAPRQRTARWSALDPDRRGRRPVGRKPAHGSASGPGGVSESGPERAAPPPMTRQTPPPPRARSRASSIPPSHSPNAIPCLRLSPLQLPAITYVSLRIPNSTWYCLSRNLYPLTELRRCGTIWQRTKGSGDRSDGARAE